MADVYQFSQSSIDLLESCIAAARQPDAKWMELFKPGSKDLAAKIEILHADEDTIILSPKSGEEVENTEEQTRDSQLALAEKIGAILEKSPNKLDYLNKQDNIELLLPVLAEKLTPECIERICSELFTRLDIENEKILNHIFPRYIKIETSCVPLNLLVSAYKTNPVTLLSWIITLFMNTDIPSKLLDEFFIVVNEKFRSEFLQTISNKEITTQVFSHHINTIISIYKNCPKTLEIHNFVLNGLLESASVSQNDKNYGRYILTFFQGLNENNAQMSRPLLQSLLDSHKTPFKKPCQGILTKLCKSQD